MAVEVSINIFGDDMFRRGIRRMAFRAIDMKPVLHFVKDDWLRLTEEQFATEGARSGHPWKQLDSSTISRRKSAHPILVETADMLLNVTDPDHINVHDDGVLMELPFGEVLDRAESHQYGYVNALTGKPVPARPFVDFTPRDRHRWESWLGDYLVNGNLPG